MHKQSTSNNFKMIYWYGERYYCGTAVDAALRSADRENAELKMTLQECHANLQSITTPISSDYWNAIALANSNAIVGISGDILVCPVPVCVEPATDLASTVVVSVSEARADSPRSVVSSSDTLSYDGGSCDGGSVNKSVRGRAVGKRNQEIYLPDGVKICHIAEKYDSDAREMIQYEWTGQYDQSANVIVALQPSQTQTQQMTYETLKHFAQEHDRETYGENYTADFTTNVWTNPLFRFYNTVACAWEPLSSLRD